MPRGRKSRGVFLCEGMLQVDNFFLFPQSLGLDYLAKNLGVFFVKDSRLHFGAGFFWMHELIYYAGNCYVNTF